MNKTGQTANEITDIKEMNLSVSCQQRALGTPDSGGVVVFTLRTLGYRASDQEDLH